MSPEGFGKVAVLCGGSSAEREVSLNSGNAVLAGLLEAGVDAHLVDVGKDIIGPLQKGGFDRVFNILHGRVGEDGVAQGAMQLLNLPYTGSGVMASAIAMDKLTTKRLWMGAGLPIPDYRKLVDPANLEGLVEKIGLPLIMKPAREGSSVGISKVESENELASAYELARKYDASVFAEAWIEGGEYTVSIVDGEAYPAICITAAEGFYDYEAKYQRNDTTYRCPCGLSADEEFALQELALEAFSVLGGEGWGRVDFMRDHQGNAWLIEANTNPGMTDHSLVPMAAKQKGLSFSQLVVKILGAKKTS